MKRALLFAAAAALASCFYSIDGPAKDQLATFHVTIDGIYQRGTTIQVPVVATCSAQYPAGVPPDLIGTRDCPFALTLDAVDVAISYEARDHDGKLLEWTRPVSFRAIPGTLVADYNFRWRMLDQGRGQAVVRATRLFGAVRIWVDDGPPEPIFADGNIVDPALVAPTDPPWTHKSGVGPVFYFEEPTLAKLNEPSIFDNRAQGAPFTNQFVTVGRPPASGDQVLENCSTDPVRNGLPLAMVVTGIDAAGFFITDIDACRIPERMDPFEQYVDPIPEPGGFFPGTFGSIYVYNYNHPDGLDVGDLLWSVSGSVQEFTSTTQLTFAAWNIAEKVRLLPEDQWDKWLKLVPVHPFTLRTCGLGMFSNLVDRLCAWSRSNLKVESLESTVVKARNVKLPDAFARCDMNADGQVEYFCDSGGGWGACGGGAVTPEMQCYIDCHTAQGQYARKVCTEWTSFANYGQITVEMAGPGPAAAGLDDSTAPYRLGQTVTVDDTASARAGGTYVANQQVSLWCDGDARYALGGSTVVADASSPELPANTLIEPFMDPGQTSVAFIGKSSGTTVHCTAAPNPRVKLLSILQDIAPELRLECDPTDANPDATAKQQCQWLRAARFDIAGHLRQVQPARPRWMIIPRDLDDVCCHPGAGMQCPTPIPQCTP